MLIFFIACSLIFVSLAQAGSNDKDGAQVAAAAVACLQQTKEPATPTLGASSSTRSVSTAKAGCIGALCGASSTTYCESQKPYYGESRPYYADFPGCQWLPPRQ